VQSEAQLLHSPNPRRPAGEELPIGGVHATLRKEWPRLLTVLAPRQASRAAAVAEQLAQQHGLRAVLWSDGGPGAGGGSRGGGAAPVSPPPLDGVDVLVLDVAANLPLIYW
jgi:3-deoxy-D-manno-octulosonic-acid transferase